MEEKVMFNHLLLKKTAIGYCTVWVLLNWTAFAQEERTWTDSTGKFTVEAVLVEFDGKNIKLKKSDNRVVTLPLEKLSDVDQQYIQQREAINPFAGGELESPSGNPPIPSGRASSLANRNVQRPVPASEMGTGKSGIVNNAKKIVPGVITGWHYKPETTTLDGEKANHKPCLIKMESGSVNSLEIVEGTDSPLALISQENLQNQTTKIYFVNMATGTDFSSVLPSLTNVWGVSPDGKRIMVSPKDHSDREVRANIEFYTFEDQNMKLADSLVPYSDQNDYNKTVEWAAWVTPRHILTCNNRNTLRFWDMETSQAIYEMSLTRKSVVLSKDRKVMVVGTHSGAVICEIGTGETLGMLTDEAPFSMEFDFSPDNTRLLGLVHERRKRDLWEKDSIPANSFFYHRPNNVVIWDLTTGEKTGEFPTDQNWTRSVRWVDNRMIIKDAMMYDSENGVPVCHYEGYLDSAQSFQGLLYYLYFTGNNESILTSAKLPHQAALDAISNIKVKDRFALHPGTAVAITVDVDESVDAGVVREHLENSLKEAGFVLNDSAAIRLTATVKKQDANDVSYSGSRFPRPPIPVPRLIPSPLDGPTVDVKITIYDHSIVLTNDGKEFWKAESSSMPPQRLEIDKDRPLQEIADELCKPNLNFFAEITIPRYHTGEAPRQQPGWPLFPFSQQNVKISANPSALINAKLTPTGVR